MQNYHIFGCWWDIKKLALLFSKRGLKGAQVLKFRIFDDLLLLLSLFVAFYFKPNFDKGFWCSFLMKFPAWFDLVVMVYKIKRVKESQKRSAIKMFTFFLIWSRICMQYFKLNFWKFLFEVFQQICCSFNCSGVRGD